MGRDAFVFDDAMPPKGFQSTRPVWGATHKIYIGKVEPYHFNPRAPYGARLSHILKTVTTCGFQSTRPVWGATTAFNNCLVSSAPFQSTRPVWGATNTGYVNYFKAMISIHAPRMGRDSGYRISAITTEYFNPRAPYGARH